MAELDLRALKIFRTVAAEGSISRAAAKLNRVQSNVSTRIRQLEARLDKELFTRGNRGLALTADGRLLLGYADRLLQLSMEASEALNEGRPSGIFRIGTMESTAGARLPELLSRYHRLHPEVEIELVTDTTGALLDRLLGHDIEVAFAAEPVAFDDLEARPVFEEKLVLVVPRSFPEIDNPHEISGRTAVAFETGCAYRRYLEDWLLAAGIVPGGVMVAGSYITILACVSAGAGFAVVPQSVLDTVASKGDFRLYPLGGALSRIRTMLTWRADYRSAKLDALSALLPGSVAG